MRFRVNTSAILPIDFDLTCYSISSCGTNQHQWASCKDSANSPTPLETEIWIMNKIFAVWSWNKNWQNIEDIFFQKTSYSLQHKTLCIHALKWNFILRIGKLRSLIHFRGVQKDIFFFFFPKSYTKYKTRNQNIFFFSKWDVSTEVEQIFTENFAY